MAGAWARDVVALFRRIFDSRPGITSPDQLWEPARRTPEGRRLRVTREGAKEWMKDAGRSQIYKDVAVQWPGKIQRPVQTDVLFDLDGLDLQRQSPSTAAQGGMKHVLLLLDRYSRKLYGRAMDTRRARETADAVKSMLAEADADDAEEEAEEGEEEDDEDEDEDEEDEDEDENDEPLEESSGELSRNIVASSSNGGAPLGSPSLRGSAEGSGVPEVYVQLPRRNHDTHTQTTLVNTCQMLSKAGTSCGYICTLLMSNSKNWSPRSEKEDLVHVEDLSLIHI